MVKVKAKDFHTVRVSNISNTIIIVIITSKTVNNDKFQNPTTCPSLQEASPRI